MNILLSSVGRRSYLVEYFKKALNGRGNVIATNSIPETAGMLAADVAEVVPPASDNEFINDLLDICRRCEVRLLFSLHDWEIPYISLNKERFLAADIVPAVPNPQIADICLDKYKTAQFANSIGVPYPKCTMNLGHAITEIDSGNLDFPLVLKPRWGQGSLSTIKVQNRNELSCAFHLINSELSNNKLDFLPEGTRDRQVLIQQFIEGQEYGVDLVNDLEGNFAACFVKKKLAMRSGETDAAETVSVPLIEKYGELISGETRHPGILDADFFISDGGTVYLLEMNPRFGGGYPFSHMAGANIPAALVAWAEGRVPDPDWLRVTQGVRSHKDIRLINAKTHIHEF